MADAILIVLSVLSFAAGVAAAYARTTRAQALLRVDELPPMGDLTPDQRKHIGKLIEQLAATRAAAPLPDTGDQATSKYSGEPATASAVETYLELVAKHPVLREQQEQLDAEMERFRAAISRLDAANERMRATAVRIRDEHRRPRLAAPVVKLGDELVTIPAPELETDFEEALRAIRVAPRARPASGGSSSSSAN